METTLEDIQAAVIADPGTTPRAVIDAFLPTGRTVFGQMLRPVSIGTWMALEKIGHPFVTGTKEADITPHDIACALYILTTDTPTVFDALRSNMFEHSVLALMDRLPLGEMKESLETMQDHFTKALDNMVPMSSPHDTGQKKKAASAGS